MRTRLFLLIFNAMSLFLKLCECQYAGYTARRMTGRFRRLEMELTKDADMKIRSINHIRRMYHKNAAYTVGQQMYHIKKQYTKMMNLYAKASDPNITPLERTKLMVEVQSLSMNIEKLTEMSVESVRAAQPRSKQKNFVKQTLRTSNSTVIRKAMHDIKENEKKAVRANARNLKKHKWVPGMKKRNEFETRWFDPRDI